MKEDNGEYYVSSAYCSHMQELLDFEHFKVHGDWCLIWKLKTRSKGKTSFGEFIEIVCQLVFNCEIKDSIVLLLTFCATLMRKIAFIYFFCVLVVEIFGLCVLHIFLYAILLIINKIVLVSFLIFYRAFVWMMLR